MEMFDILNTVKQKLFEPRKKIVVDSLGNKRIQDSKNWVIDRHNTRKFVNDYDFNILDECDGWNVADKDYVDFKILEAFQKPPNSLLPSAPMETPRKSSSLFSSSVPKQLSYFFSNSVIKNDAIVFFSPGIVLKKGWCITEFTIFCDIAIEEELTLSVCDLAESKITVLSKIKPKGKQILAAETKHKIDSTKAFTFILTLPKSVLSVINMSMQFAVEN